VLAHHIEAAEADIARFAKLYPMNARPVQNSTDASSSPPAHGEASMADDPKDVVEAASRSALVNYAREDDPDWRSPSWIMPEECAHLTKAILRELEAQGFQIVKKQPDAK
jgi:hypothetical protein